jgi:hypothetical protein
MFTILVLNRQSTVYSSSDKKFSHEVLDEHGELRKDIIRV